MSSWTTQELSLPAITSENVVSKEFLNRDPQYMVVEITGVATTPGNITIEDSADGKVFSVVKSGVTFDSDTKVAILRFDASVETSAAPLRNICRIKIANTNVAYSKVYVTWSP